MLIDARIGQAGPELFDIRSDGDRLDVLEGNAEILAPAGELADGLGVGGPSFVIVSDEELEKGSGGVVAEVGDGRRDCKSACGPDDDLLIAALVFVIVAMRVVFLWVKTPFMTYKGRPVKSAGEVNAFDAWYNQNVVTSLAK